MSRDKGHDPRLEARNANGEDDGAALVWSLIYIGDAVMRLGKAVETAAGVHPKRFNEGQPFNG